MRLHCEVANGSVARLPHAIARTRAQKHERDPVERAVQLRMDADSPGGEHAHALAGIDAAAVLANASVYSATSRYAGYEFPSRPSGFDAF